MKQNIFIGFALLMLMATISCSSKPKAASSNPQAFINGSMVKMRKEPSASSDEVGALAFGTPVQVISKVKDWAQINVGGYSGYVKEKFLSKSVEVSIEQLASLREKIKSSDIFSKLLYEGSSKLDFTQVILNKKSEAIVDVNSFDHMWSIRPKVDSNGYFEIYGWDSNYTIDDTTNEILYIEFMERLLFTNQMTYSRYSAYLTYLQLKVNLQYQNTPNSIIESFPAMNPIFDLRGTPSEKNLLDSMVLLDGIEGINYFSPTDFDVDNSCGKSASDTNFHSIMAILAHQKLKFRFDEKTKYLVLENSHFVSSIDLKLLKLVNWGKYQFTFNNGRFGLKASEGQKVDSTHRSSGAILLSSSSDFYKMISSKQNVGKLSIQSEKICGPLFGTGKTHECEAESKATIFTFPDYDLSLDYKFKKSKYPEGEGEGEQYGLRITYDKKEKILKATNEFFNTCP